MGCLTFEAPAVTFRAYTERAKLYTVWSQNPGFSVKTVTGVLGGCFITPLNTLDHEGCQVCHSISRGAAKTWYMPILTLLDVTSHVHVGALGCNCLLSTIQSLWHPSMIYEALINTCWGGKRARIRPTRRDSHGGHSDECLSRAPASRTDITRYRSIRLPTTHPLAKKRGVPMPPSEI